MRLHRCIMRWEEEENRKSDLVAFFYLWRSGVAVGLSAVSFLAPFAKDAAPIPSAGGAPAPEVPYIN